MCVCVYDREDIIASISFSRSYEFVHYSFIYYSFIINLLDEEEMSSILLIRKFSCLIELLTLS